MTQRRIIHKELAAGRWFALPLIEQLANVGCDIGRAIAWKEKGESEHSKHAFERALELLDLTIIDPKNEVSRMKHCLIRRALIDHFVFDNEYNTTDEQWRKYFFQFNYAAALQRRR